MAEISEIQEGAFDSQNAHELARTSMDFFAALAMPTIFKYFFPAIFKSIWAWVITHLLKIRDFSYLAIGLPRGFGKTLVIKLLILYAIIFTQRQFIIIISENEKKAISILSDVEDMLNEPNVKALFGDWSIGIDTNNALLKVFSYRGRSIILKAAGAGSGIRGITEKNLRPDFMIFDDIQSREDSQSEQLSDALESWMYATALKAKSPEGCLFVFIANMYPTKGSLLRRMKKNPTWTKYIVGGITADGKSLWEDLQPIQQLLREFINDLNAGHPEIFYAEVLNDENATVNNLVDISKIPPYPFRDDDIPLGKFIVIDPSNDKATSDAVSIGYFELHNERPALLDVIEGRMSPGETIANAITLAMNKGCRIIGVESNAYQYSLLYWFTFICQQRGIEGIEFVELYSGVRSKNSRIIKMFTMLVPQEIFIGPRARPNVFAQITSFNPLRIDNVDGVLDLLTYGPKMVELYGEQIISQSVIIEQEANTLEVIEYNSPF